MALNDLTLSVSQGIAGRPFRSKINGLTDGSVTETDNTATPGFSVVNGFLRHPSLPSGYLPTVAVVTERDSSTGESKTSRLAIAVATKDDLRARADELLPEGTSMLRFGASAAEGVDGSLAWSVEVENTSGRVLSGLVSDAGPVSAPGSIADLTAVTQSSSEVLLTFTPATGATSHQMRIDGGPASACDNGSHLVSSLTAATGYDFEVRGANGAGFGNWSNVANATTDAPPAPVVINERFGVLTEAGASGIPVDGSSITSGDPDGHFQITDGILTKSSAGASLSQAPYSLVLNNGDTINIAADANAYDVRTQAEYDALCTAANTATLAGKTVFVRPDSYRSGSALTSNITGASGTFMRRVDMGGLTIQGRVNEITSPPTYPTFDRFVLDGTRNATFRYLGTPETPLKKFDMVGRAAPNIIDGITIDRCFITGQPVDPNGDFSASGSYPNADLVTTNGAGNIGTITLTNNWVQYCARGFNLFSATGTSIVCSGNFIDYYYDDGINISYGGADVPVYVEDNVIGHPLGKGTDADNPHVDAIRGVGSITAPTDWHWYLHRNRIFHGNSRGDLQGVLLSDFKTTGGDSGKFFIVEATGNVIAWETTQAFNIENAKSCILLNNTVVKNNTDGTGTAAIKVGTGSTDSTSSGTHILERNISEGYSIAGTPTLLNNLTLGIGGATIPYVNVFDGPTWDPDSLAELMASFNMKAGGNADLGGVSIGAIGSGAVTWATSVPGDDGVNIATIESGGGEPAPTPALIDTFTAASTRITPIPNGIYSVLLRGGTGGNRWVTAGAATGKAFIDAVKAGGETFDAAHFFGPHGISGKTAGTYANPLYWGLFGNSPLEGGSLYDSPYAFFGRLNNVTTGGNVAPVHQGWAGGDANYYYTFDSTAPEDGIRKRSRVDWSIIDSNTAVPGHCNGCYYAGTIAGITGALLIASENYSASGSDTFRLYILDPDTAGMPIVKTIVLGLTAGAGGDEISGCTVDTARGRVIFSDYHQNAYHWISIADVTSVADGDTITPTQVNIDPEGIYERRQGVTYNATEDALLFSSQLVSPATGAVVEARRAADGIELGCWLMVGASAGSREGLDYDVVSGKIGILFDNTGSTGSSVVNFWDAPIFGPASAAGGIVLDQDFGITWPGVRLDDAFAVMGFEVPVTVGSTSSLNGGSGRPSILSNTGSGAAYHSTVSSLLRLEMRIQAGTTNQASPAEQITIASGRRWAWGVNYDDASPTSAQSAYSFYDASEFGAASIAENWATSAPPAQTFPAKARMGIGLALASGRRRTTFGMAWIGPTPLTQAQMDAMKDDPSLVFDITNPLTSGEKAAYEATL